MWVAPLVRQALAEFLGSAGLVTVVIGSGIAAQRLTNDVGLQLLENALVTGAGIATLILACGPVSGAHFSPVVTAADRVFRGLNNRQVVAYLPALFSGGIVGTVAANLAYGWSSSTSFANPMMDVARTLSDTFAGIAPSSAPMFLLMQLFGAAAFGVVHFLYPDVTEVADDVVVPHHANVTERNQPERHHRPRLEETR